MKRNPELALRLMRNAGHRLNAWIRVLTERGCKAEAIDASLTTQRLRAARQRAERLFDEHVDGMTPEEARMLLRKRTSFQSGATITGLDVTIDGARAWFFERLKAAR